MERITRGMFTYLSSVAARMYFPFGENVTNETGGLSSSANKTDQFTINTLS